VKSSTEEGRLSAHEHKRKEQILTQHEPSKVRESTRAVVLKHGSIFLLTMDSGDIPWSEPHGFGLFYQDCRFLDGYTLSINGEMPTVLSFVDVRGFETRHYLANPICLLPTRVPALAWRRTQSPFAERE
jgi:hypothetical protein